ncbi:MFS transporter [Brevibacterium album]|uniref:MFS transporter n=1 Tax=Brevibacterium album TaxID=417948 RepID=UPI0004288ECE|nr:MFS transporter [Brevibacterium album]
MSTPRIGPVPGAPSRSAVAAWALWDWGSAAFNAVIVTFVFAPYLTSAVAADEASGSAALGWATAAAGLVIALVAPAIGTRADTGGRHRFWLGFHTFVVIASMAAMFFVRDTPEHLWLGLILLAAGSVFFEFAEVSYNSILLSLSTPATVGRISGLGWGLGYLGGLALLVLLLFTVIQPETGLFGATDENGLRYRLVALLAAAWFAVFALPVLFMGPRSATSGTKAAPGSAEGTAAQAGSAQAETSPAPEANPAARPARASGASPLSYLRGFAADYRRLGRRLARMWREDHTTLRFLIASAVFRDGLAAIFAFAGILAAGSYGFSPSEVIVLGVAANLVAGLGSVGAGVLDDRLGPRIVIVVSLVCLIIGAIPILLSDSPVVFWAAAMFLCIFVGPVLASSRSYLARITPPEHAGENFGLYATTGRAVSFLGPACFSLAVMLLGFQRAGALGIALVLAVGLVLFLGIRAPAGADPRIRAT